MFCKGIEQFFVFDLYCHFVNIPCAIGFGISNTKQARQICEVSDGIIFGSAIVKIIEQYGKNCVPYVIAYVKKMIQTITSQ